MSYRGLKAEIPLGTEGLTGTPNTTMMPPGYLSEANNISLANGNIQKEGGASKYNASAISGGPVVLGGWDHNTNSLAHRMVIACNDGKLYKDSGAGTFAVVLKTGLSATMAPYFVEGGKEVAAANRKLFIFTGTNPVQILADDAATTTDISTPPADWSGTNQPTFGLIHAYRMLAAGNANDPHRVYYSIPSNHEDFTTAGASSLSVYPGEGEALVGGISFNDYAIVFKRPRGIYAIDMRSASSSNWTIKRVSRAVGLASPWALAQTETDVIFIDCTGSVQSLTNSLANADVEARDLGQQSLIEPTFRGQLNLSRTDRIKGVYYIAKREVHFAFSSTGSTVNDRRLVLDLFRPDKIRYRISDRDVCESLWLRQDADGIPRPVAGDDTGFVWLLDQATYTKGGLGYASKATTVPTDLGFIDPAWAGRHKNAAFLELVYQPTAFDTVDVTVIWDNAITQVVTFTLTTSGAALGAFVLGTDELSAVGFASQIRRLYGGGKFLSLSIANNTVGTNFSINRLRLYFTLGND